MKKKLEAELISIAHRILKLKDKSELILLHHETQKLYETLSVLRFLEQNFEGAKPTIGRAEVESILEKSLESKSLLSLELPEESIPEVTNAFAPVAVFMPEEVSEDRSSEDEESSSENSIVEPVAVFMPEEITEDRDAKDEEQPSVEDEISKLVAAFMPKTETEDFNDNSEILEEELPSEIIEEDNLEEEEETSFIQEGFESYEAESDEVPEFPVAQEIETEPSPEIEMPHIIEIEEEPEVEPIPEEEPEEEPEPAETSEENEHKSWLNYEINSEEEDKKAPIEISFADLLGHDYNEPIFERVEDLKSSVAETPVFEKETVGNPFEQVLPNVEVPEMPAEPHFETPVSFEEPSVSAEEPVNLDYLKPITFALNDKIGFEKHLFGGSGEEMHRVISQLHSFKTFEEAQEFIQDMVKPDYNNWEGKEDYEQRFMEIVERRFL